MLWLIACEVIQVEAKDDTSWLNPYASDANFMDEYNLYESSLWHVFIKITYYMFTSLSTVGLGDVSPTNDIERLMCIFMLLFGVLLITYLMEIMVELMQKYVMYTSTLGSDQD